MTKKKHQEKPLGAPGCNFDLELFHCFHKVAFTNPKLFVFLKLEERLEEPKKLEEPFRIEEHIFLNES